MRLSGPLPMRGPSFWTVPLLLPGLCLADPAYVEVGLSCFQKFSDPENASVQRSLCVQKLACPSSNLSYARIITEKEIESQQIPGGEVVWYSSGTAAVSCIECVRELCSLVNGTLPVITSQEDNQCVLDGGSVGTKARIPIAATNANSEGWIWPPIWGYSNSYSNWIGSTEPSGIPSMNLCTTMNKDGKWSSTPCDMTSYHTQKDYLVCSVPNHIIQGDTPEGQAGQRASAGGEDSSSPALYYATPTAIGVLIVALVVWRKSLDNEPREASTEDRTFVFYDGDNEKKQGNPGDKGSIRSTDSEGYLMPMQLGDEEEQPLYYEAHNSNGSGQEEDGESHYDQVAPLENTTNEVEEGQYDLAVDSSREAHQNHTYVYGKENGDKYSTVEKNRDTNHFISGDEVET